MAKILIADDELEIIELLRLYLENDGFDVVEARDGFEAWEKIRTEEIDLAVLDVMMPKIDGFHLLKKIREKMQIPVILLSAKNEDMNKILGLGLGADDYIGKPFNPLEVVARVNAQLRRAKQFGVKEEPIEENLSIGPFVLDKGACTVTKDGEEIYLTSMEYKILLMLMSKPNRVFTRAQIFEQVVNELSDGDDNTIMVHIRKIREKIEDDPSSPVYIKTIRGLGYRFEKKV